MTMQTIVHNFHFGRSIIQYTAFALVAVTILLHPASAQQKKDPEIGKEVMTIKWGAEFKLEKKIVDRVDLGRVFRVDSTNGSWLHVMGKSGWLSKNDVVSSDKALFHFNVELRKAEGQNESNALHHRGLAYNGLGQFKEAITDFDKAIKLSPKESTYYNSRGFSYHRQGNYKLALADYNKAIELNNKGAGFYNNRGILYRDLGQYDKAIADYDQAIKLSPYFSQAYNAKAWLQATCPDKKYANVKEAVENAKRACNFTNWRDDIPIGTLSAALARGGDYTEALKWIAAAEKINPHRFTEKRAAMKKEFAAKKPFVEQINGKDG